MVLKKFEGKACLVYIDIFIIYSNKVEEDIRHVYEILTTLAESGVTLKMNKCTFFNPPVE